MTARVPAASPTTDAVAVDRHVELDVARVCAILAVISIHVLDGAIDGTRLVPQVAAFLGTVVLSFLIVEIWSRMPVARRLVGF